jgi:hypothetical protein
MNITLKNIKHSETFSEETHCFTATVYLDGKPAFGVKNDGHGGSNMYYSVPNGTNHVHALVEDIDKELGKEKVLSGFDDVPPMDNCLEFVVGELIDNWLIDKEIKRCLKKICYVKEGSVYTTKTPATAAAVDAYKAAPWFKEKKCIMLNDLVLADIRPFFQ